MSIIESLINQGANPNEKTELIEHVFLGGLLFTGWLVGGFKNLLIV